jgi:hypothetical protein
MKDIEVRLFHEWNLAHGSSGQMVVRLAMQ